MEHNKQISDLEYLSERGFEVVPEAIGDLNALNKKISKSVRRSRLNLWVYLSIGLGLSLVAAIWLGPEVKTKETASNISLPANENTVKQIEFTLDSIEIIGEKFIRQQTNSPSNSTESIDTHGILLMSPQQIPLPKTDMQLQTSRLEQVIYIRELKIVEYGLLYFEYNRELTTKGIPASSSGKSIVLHDNDTKLYEILDEGLKYYREGDYAAAMVKFRVLLNFNMQDLNAQFYMGMCAYHRGWYSQAINYYTLAIEALNPAFKEESAYYLALCLSYYNKTLAIEKMKLIAGNKGFYQARAIEWLKTMERSDLNSSH